MSNTKQPKRIIHQSEQRYQELLESISDRVVILNPEGLVLNISQRSLADAHLRREEVVGKPFIQTPWWSYAPAARRQLHAAIEQARRGDIVHLEARIRPREGWYLDLAVTITPHLGTDGQVEYLIYAGQDITARKRAEAETHALINALPQLVWTGRPDGYIDAYSQSWCDYTGMTLRQAQGNGWMQCTHPDDRQRVLADWQHAFQAGKPYETEQRLRQGSTGAYRWFLMQATPLKDAQGTVLKYVGTCTYIDDRKRAEQQLKESEENWHALAETIPQLVWIGQPGGPKEYFNQRWFDYTQATYEQMRGTGWLRFLHPADQEHTLALGRHALKTGEPYESENRFKEGRTGTYRWFLSRALPVRDEAGHIIKWFGTLTDIEDQKQIEQRLKESEENWRVLAETMPQIVWVSRPDGLNVYKNQRWYDYTGEQKQNATWAHLAFIHPDDQESSQALWQHALETGAMFEHEERLRNGQTGEYRWFLTRGTPIRDEAGRITKWFGTLTDIDNQKRVEEALRQSQERVNALMDSKVMGITLIEGEQIVDANDTFLRMVGYTREDLRAGRINWMRMTPPEYLACTQQAQQELTTRQSMTPYEKELICKDGSRLPVLSGMVALQHSPHQAIGFELDNAARKELDQRKDDFINMASHELRNPLAALKLQTTLLHRQLARQGIPASAPALSRMDTQLDKMTRLVEELLDVSKIQAGRLEYRQETVDLAALLLEIAGTMQQTDPRHTIVVCGAGQASVIGDRDRLGQVFTNLLSNAIKYSPDAQTVEIDMSTSADAVMVRVRDHGLGIPREQCEKIFERFYRAAGPRQKAIPGLGMGLYIVAEIVKHHRGTITVDSTVGEGSVFTVTLPLNDETPD